MTIWRNVSVGIGSSAWTAVIGLAAVPVYLRYLGVEAYGLVGFFLALQAMFQLLDLGLAPTISREVARCQARSILPEARDLLLTFSVFYWAVAVVIAIGTTLAASWIGNDWLHPERVSRADTIEAVVLMGLIIAIRFPIGLYTGVIQGAQRLAEASMLGAAVSTIGVVGGVALLAFVSPTIRIFFVWQIVLAIAHLVAVRWGAWHLLGGKMLARFDWNGLRRIGRFAAAMSIVSVLGVLLSQLDKLILSREVSLADLGRYTLAGIPARSLGLLTLPVFSVVYSRLSALVAVDDLNGIRDTYRKGTRLFLSLLLPVSVFMGLYSHDLIYAWTGNEPLARQVATPATLLIFGSALNSIMIFPFSLQLAFGNSRLPAMITLMLIAGFVPLLLWLIDTFGMVGAAAAWLALNATYVPLGTWLTHRSMLTDSRRAWLLKDVGLPLFVSIAVIGIGSLAAEWLSSPLWRLAVGVGLLPCAFALIVAVSPSMLPAGVATKFFKKTFRKNH